MNFANASHRITLYDRNGEQLASVWGFATVPQQWTTATPDGQSVTRSEAGFLTELWPAAAQLEQGFARAEDLLLRTSVDYDIRQVSISAQTWTMTLAVDRREVPIA